MDELKAIQEHIQELKDFRDAVAKEIEHRRQEIDHIKTDELGVMKKIKDTAKHQMLRGASAQIEGAMREVYERLRGTFKDPIEYMDHLRSSIDHMKHVISEAENIISNLEKISRDLKAKLDEADRWIKKTEDLTRR